MIKKTITFKNYNDEEITEDFYFDISEAELLELELSVDGGMSEMLKSMIAKKDVPEIIKTVKKLILLSYGEKSIDGRRFIKSEELSKAFTETRAYSELLMELVSNDETAIAFINGIIPSIPKTPPQRLPNQENVVNDSPSQQTHN